MTSTLSDCLLGVSEGRGDCLVVTVLFCRDGGVDSFEEDLRCGPKLGVLVDLLELHGVVATLFKTVEALERCLNE